MAKRRSLKSETAGSKPALPTKRKGGREPMITLEFVNDFLTRKTGILDPDSLSELQRFEITLSHLVNTPALPLSANLKKRTVTGVCQSGLVTGEPGQIADLTAWCDEVVVAEDVPAVTHWWLLKTEGKKPLLYLGTPESLRKWQTRK